MILLFLLGTQFLLLAVASRLDAAFFTGSILYLSSKKWIFPLELSRSLFPILAQLFKLLYVVHFALQSLTYVVCFDTILAAVSLRIRSKRFIITTFSFPITFSTRLCRFFLLFSTFIPLTWSIFMKVSIDAVQRVVKTKEGMGLGFPGFRGKVPTSPF